MLVARGRRVRACDLDREQNRPGGFVASNALDQCELAIVMDDVCLVHGIPAVSVTEAVATTSFATGRGGERAAATAHEAFAGLNLLLYPLLHPLLVLAEARHSLIAPGRGWWWPDLKAGESLVRRFNSAVRERLDELVECFAGNHDPLSAPARLPAACCRAPSNVGQSPVHDESR